VAVSKAVEIGTRGAALVEADAQPAPDAAADVRAVPAASSEASPEAAPARTARQEPLDLEALIEAHRDRVTRLAYRLLGWRGGEVEDVVQDVFVSALRHLHRFRGESSAATWLTAITLNRCRTEHRRRRLRRLLLWRSAEERTARSGAPAWNRPAEQETAERVREAVRALPPRDREVVVLRYFEQLNSAEIAAATRQSVGAVEVRLHRARGRLAATLAELAREVQK
jgi:RNA polymerase sigma factor (sigma-70 family)